MAKKIRKRDAYNRPIDILEEMRLHAVLWKNDTTYSKLNKNIKDSLEIFLDNITTTQSLNNIEKICSGEAKDVKNSETNKFITIYREKYLELTDFNCDEKINNTCYVIVRAFIDKLNKQGSTVNEYLMWFFDDFLADNPKLCPPTIRLSISSSVTAKFFFEMKDKLKARKENKENSQRRLALMKLGAEIFEMTSDAEFGKQLIKFGSNKMALTKFKKLMMEFAKDNQLFEIEARLKVLK